ncbi:hypothetical protein Golob_011894, partial [Gossypium lobatum]|nr:hypothetical protein [Gossypium lobatum]
MLALMVVCHKAIPSLFAAEAHACYQALRLGVHLGLDSIVIEGDSLTIIKKCRSDRRDNEDWDHYWGRFFHGWGHSELCVTSNGEEEATEPGLNEKGKWVSSKKWLQSGLDLGSLTRELLHSAKELAFFDWLKR